MDEAGSGAVRVQLRRILAAPAFADSERLSALLTFLVEQALAGQVLKEQRIAVEVFGRPPGFDAQADSVVRVQTRNLRKKLEEYYAAEGAGEPVRILVPQRTYTPDIQILAPASQAKPPRSHRRVAIAAALLAVALGLGAALLLTVRGAASSRGHTPTREVQELYTLGAYLGSQRDPASQDKGADYLERALARDPAYVPALEALALTCANRCFYAAPHKPKWAFEGRESARKALAADPANAKAHQALASILYFYDWDWPAAEAEYRRALAQDFKYAAAHDRYGLALVTRGRFAEAVVEAQRAREVEPGSFALSAHLGVIYYLARRFDEGEALGRWLLTVKSGNDAGHFLLGSCALGRKQYREGLRELGLMRPLDDTEQWGLVGFLRARCGDRAGALEAVARISATPESNGDFASAVATIYAGLGDRDRTFQWLNQAAERRETSVLFIPVDPAFDDLRSDPRFDALRRRLGLL